MAQKYVELPGIGRVLLAKRRGSRNLRLTIRPDGIVRVGLPAWAPYAAGIKFALDRSDWIDLHLSKIAKPQLSSGRRIGKSYRLVFRQDPAQKTVATRVTSGEIRITSPYPSHHMSAQAAAVKASERALKADAARLLRIRLDEMAAKHGFSYSGFSVKKLRSRWGSCSSQGDITFNIYLIQLPWQLIDYVIAHELCHTRHLDHSRYFWERLQTVMPEAKTLRRRIRAYRPDVMVE